MSGHVDQLHDSALITLPRSSNTMSSRKTSENTLTQWPSAAEPTVQRTVLGKISGAQPNGSLVAESHAIHTGIALVGKSVRWQSHCKPARTWLLYNGFGHACEHE